MFDKKRKRQGKEEEKKRLYQLKIENGQWKMIKYFNISKEACSKKNKRNIKV